MVNATNSNVPSANSRACSEQQSFSEASKQRFRKERDLKLASTSHGTDQAFMVKEPSRGTLSGFSAVASLWKDKTCQIAQQQKRTLLAFQQQGGLVNWLHGDVDESTRMPSRLNDLRNELGSNRRLVSLRTNVEVEIPIERQRSIPNLKATSLIDTFCGQEPKVALSCPHTPMEGIEQPRFVNANEQLLASDGESRPRAATTDVPPCSTSTATSIPSRTHVAIPFLLDQLLVDEWSCIVLWAYLFSSAGKDNHQHQRLSFLIATTFQVTPLYRKVAESGPSFEKTLALNELIDSLTRYFLVHPGATALATGDVPVASSAASHAKHQLAIAVLSLTDQTLEEISNRPIDSLVDATMSALFQLVREVEREFRALETNSYATFLDSSLYREFVALRSGPENLATLLRAARIPFYQQPHRNSTALTLEMLQPNEDMRCLFSKAKCQVFTFSTRLDRSIQCTKLTESSHDGEESPFALAHTITPFLNPSGHDCGKSLAFNFIASSGVTFVYGAVVWLQGKPRNDKEADDQPTGLCVTSPFPLVDSLRSFGCKLWSHLSSKTTIHKTESIAVEFQPTVEAFLASEPRIVDPFRQISGTNDRFPAIDFQLADLFDSLSLSNVLRLFALVLLEKQIVLVASSYTLLVSVSETLRALLYPLVWSHVYIPVLPLALKAYLQCPTPFLVGLHDAYVRECEIPRPSKDLVIVNLNRDALTGGGNVSLPPRRHSRMRDELFRLLNPHLVARDSLESVAKPLPSAPVSPSALRHVFDKHVRELLACLEPCVNRIEFQSQIVAVLDHEQRGGWPTDTAHFYAAVLHTQAVSTYMASPRV